MHSSLHVDILICPQSWMFLLCADPLYITCGCYLSTLTVLHTVSLYWGSPTCRTPYVELRAGLHRPTYLLSFLRNNIHLDQSQRSIISHDNCSSPIGWRQAPSSLDIALLARPHEPLQALVVGGGDLRHLLLVDVLVLHEDDGLLPGVEARQGFISKRCECNRAGWTVTCPGAHCVYVHHLLR